MASASTASSLPPDPKALSSWEEAFTSHPLPTIRKLEQQLRRNIDENRSKLRTLVGSSYRDLLGTAERIIEMDGQIQSVEASLGSMGRRCNAGLVERVGGNFGKLKKVESGRGKFLAQVRVARGCVGFVGRVVRRGGLEGRGDALVAAKVLVLGRLVHKGLSEQVDAEGRDGVLLEELRRKLGSARKRLLGFIGRTLAERRADDEEEEHEREDKDNTIKTLCAYSLISSAGPRDVLRYFMQVRFEQLEAKAEEGNLVGMLDLYSQTLLDAKDMFPRRFTEALGALAKGTLVMDKDVRAVQELSLDIYEQWIEEDVRHFHPWVRHDQLSVAEVGDALSSWTRQAQECLLSGLRETLKEQTDAKTVLEVRQKVLSKYQALSAKVRSDAHAKALDDIRAAFLSRLEDLAAQAAKIADFSVEETHSLKTSAASMWDLATTDLDLNNGAIQFRKAVIHRQHGHSPSIDSVASALDTWIERLKGFTEFISAMRTIKWDDDLDLDLDDLADGESLQVILSKKDPQLLEVRLQQETTTALRETYRRIERALESETYSPTILIRVVREVDRRRRGLGDRFEKLDSAKADPTFIAALHRQVAASIGERSVLQFCQNMQKGSHTPMTLWDGTPPLPIQPSPGTFRFLKTLHEHMSEAGTDLWSPDAVQALTGYIAEKVVTQLDVAKIISATEASLTSRHADQKDGQADENATATRNRVIQLLFDVLYLQRVFRSTDNRAKLEGVVEEIGRRAEHEATGSMERLRKNAVEYWRRTYLLFGLLAVGQPS